MDGLDGEEGARAPTCDIVQSKMSTTPGNVFTIDQVNDCLEIVHREVMSPMPWLKVEEGRAKMAVENDPNFSNFLSKLNIENLQGKMIDYSKDLELVEALQHGLIRYIESELRSKFYDGELHRVGSCQDGSKVGKINEIDCLYVITRNIRAEKEGKNSYILYDGETKVEPVVIQEQLADTIESSLQGWKWGDRTLVHGGYMSPEFSGVRYNGPAVTMLLVHRVCQSRHITKTPLSLDITAVFHLPTDPKFEELTYSIDSRFREIKSITDKKILDLGGVHLVPKLPGCTWQVTTALLEACLLRDLHHSVPVKRAFGYVKIISHDLTEANECGLINQVVLNVQDNVQNISNQVVNYKEQFKRLPVERSMRYGHMFLSKEVAEMVTEIGKSAISINSAAIKHILLNQALEDPKMFTEIDNSVDLEEYVYSLIVSTFEVLSMVNPPFPSIPHAILDETNINVFGISKRSLINRTYPLLQAVLVEECERIHNKINIAKWSFTDCLNVDDTNIVRQHDYVPVPTRELTFPEYMYKMNVDFSVSPNRNPKVPDVLNIINGLMNSCGGIVTLKHETTNSVMALNKWMQRFHHECSNYDIILSDISMQYKMCTDHNDCPTGSMSVVASVRQSHNDDNITSSTLTSYGCQTENKKDLCNGQVDVFVKPCPHCAWLQHSILTQVHFQTLQSGDIKRITQTQSNRYDGSVLTNIDDELNVLAHKDSPTGKCTLLFPKLKHREVFSECYIDSILKSTKQLSWTEQHNQPWETYIEHRPTDIHNRLTTTSGILKVARPLIITPSLDVCPGEIRDHMRTIEKRYHGRSGFGVWFYALNSNSERPLTTGKHAFLLCYTQGEYKLDLWSVSSSPTIDPGIENMHIDLMETGRTIKWLCVDQLRQNNWMSSQLGNLTIRCRSNWGEDTDVTYPLCEFLQCEEGSLKLGAVFGQIMITEIKEVCLRNTLYNNFLLSLTYDQVQHLVNFGSHQLNFIEGPPGSGKSVVASFLSDVCLQQWHTKPIYFCASHSFKSVLKEQGNCQPYVIESDRDLAGYIGLFNNLDGKHCLIIDDAQNMSCSQKTWTHLLQKVVDNNVHMYVFADHQYQNFRTQENMKLADWMYAVATERRISYNKSYLSEVHRNSKKIVSFICASFSEVSDIRVPCKIVCKNNKAGDDIEFVKVSNLHTLDQTNGLLIYIQSIMGEYEPRHIAIMIDCDNASDVIQQTIDMLKTCLGSECEIHGADIYPRTGITVDHLDNFVGIDAPLCIYPVLKNKDEIRNLGNPKYRAFIASRAVFRLVLVQTEDFDHTVAKQFQLDQNKLVRAKDNSQVTSSFKLDQHLLPNLDDKATITVGGVVFEFHEDDLQPLEYLGEGSYASVVTMMHVPSNTVMAVKKIPYKYNPEEQKRLFMDLYVNMRKENSLFTVRFYGVLFRESQMWICMERMDMSLDKFCEIVYSNDQCIPENVLGKITLAVVHALQFLKTKLNVIHRDVKPSNMLINRTGEVKICDFGMSGYLVDSMANTMAVRLNHYLAPERPSSESKGYDIRSDVWSLGISLMELATGKFPYNQSGTPFEFLKQVVMDPPPQLPTEDFSPEITEFINMCLTKNEKKRPKYAELLQQPFLRKYENEHVDVAGFVQNILDKYNIPDITT